MPPCLMTLINATLSLLGIAAVIMLSACVGVNFFNVVGRYGFHRPLEWAEEVMLYLMIGVVFLGAARVAWSGGHIRMDIFVRMLPRPVRGALQLLSEAVLMVTCLALVWFAYPTIHQLYDFDQRSMAAEIPMFIPQAVIPVGLLAMAVLVALRLIGGRWRDASHDFDH